MPFLSAEYLANSLIPHIQVTLFDQPSYVGKQVGVTAPASICVTVDYVWLPNGVQSMFIKSPDCVCRVGLNPENRHCAALRPVYGIKPPGYGNFSQYPVQCFACE